MVEGARWRTVRTGSSKKDSSGRDSADDVKAEILSRLSAELDAPVSARMNSHDRSSVEFASGAAGCDNRKRLITIEEFYRHQNL